MSAPFKVVPVRSSSSRPGFTLIELLVVIAIIGILVGLLFPAVQAVRRGVFQNTVSTDIEQISAAVEQFKMDYGHFPSDFTEFLAADGTALGFFDPIDSTLYPQFAGVTVQTRLEQILRRISPSHNESSQEPTQTTNISRLQYWWENVGVILAENTIGTVAPYDTRFHRTRGPQVALWFWLTQLYNDAQFPLTGARRGLTSPDSQFVISEREVFFDFGPTTLQQISSVAYPTRNGTVLANGNNAYQIFRSMQRDSDSPMVYFHHNSYGSAGVDFDYEYLPASEDSSNFAAALIVRPDFDGDNTTTEFFAPTEYQIFTPGYSESFGNFNLNVHTPTNPDDIERINNADFNESLDNLTNFAEGRIDAFLDQVAN